MLVRKRGLGLNLLEYRIAVRLEPGNSETQTIGNGKAFSALYEFVRIGNFAGIQLHTKKYIYIIYIYT
jgi:hypothetical protein